MYRPLVHEKLDSTDKTHNQAQIIAHYQRVVSTGKVLYISEKFDIPH